MKYLIEDHNSCPIAYLKDQLRLTDLKYENCRVDDSLATKVAMHEIGRILTENGCEGLTIHNDSITLGVSGSTLSFAPMEVMTREVTIMHDKSDIVYTKGDVIMYAKEMYMNSNYSDEFIEECFATVK